MKAKRTLLVMALLGGLTSVALGQSTNSVLSASAVANTTAPIATKTQIQPTYPPPQQYKLIEPGFVKKEQSTKIIRLGKESSQAWTTIACEQPNPTVDHDCSKHEPKLCLLSLKFGLLPKR